MEASLATAPPAVSRFGQRKLLWLSGVRGVDVDRGEPRALDGGASPVLGHLHDAAGQPGKRRVPARVVGLTDA